MKYLFLITILIILFFNQWLPNILRPIETLDETITGKVVLIKSDYILMTRCNGETCSPPIKVKQWSHVELGQKITVTGKWDGDVFIALISAPDLTLIRVGRNWPVKSINTGRQHDTLQRLAETKSAEQARVKIQSHSGWDARMSQLSREVRDCDSFAEVVNESQPGQDTEQASREMYRSWEQSRGKHWATVDGRCTYWGFSMARGSNGIWYACGIFGYARNK